jgi:hypothetical protein
MGNLAPTRFPSALVGAPGETKLIGLQGLLEEHPQNCAELILWTSQTGD